MKECRICNEIKELNCFPTRKYKDNVSYRNECKECTSKFMKKYRSENKEKIAKLKKEWVENNKDRKREYNYNWFLNNKEKARKSVRNHRVNNPEHYRYKRAERRAKELKATLSGYDKEIKEIYKNCPEGHHVDHIMPLVNDRLCGLHVPWNLQYLPAEENLKKGNKVLE